MPKPNLIPVGDVERISDLPKYEVKLIDESDPKSVVNLLPVAIKEAIHNVNDKFPHYLAESEVELQALLKPTELDDRLRVAFWAEYQRALSDGRKMVVKNIYGPFITDKHFYTKVVPSPQRMAWLLKQPENYTLSSEASLHNGKNTMSKIMRMEIFDKEGNIKVKEAGIFLKAYELLENRVKGAVLQRTVSAHMKVPDENSEEARKELEALQSKRKAIEVKDVTEVQASDE